MRRMTWFPWGQSETLFSIVARWHHLAGHPDPRVTAELAFGYERAWAQCHFERGLERFCDFAGIDESYLPKLISRRTLMPFGRKFFGLGRSRVDEEFILKGRFADGGRALEYMGLFPEQGIKLLKCCAVCAETDRQELGSVTWRLEHQLPGLLFCNLHGVPLRGAERSSNPHWITASAPQRTIWDSEKNDRLKSIGRFLGLFHQEEKATRGSVQLLLETLLREAQILPPKRRKSDALRRWWASAMPAELMQAFPSFQWSFVDSVYRSPRPHPLLIAAVLDRLCSPDEFRSLIQSQTLQCDIDGNWNAIGDMAVWHLPRRVVWEIEGGRPISLVAKRAGVSVEALRHWLRSNPEVKRVRSVLLSDLQIQERRGRVRQVIAESKRRSEVMRSHSADVRWLELHDAAWMSEQWRALWGRSLRQRQRNLF